MQRFDIGLAADDVRIMSEVRFGMLSAWWKLFASVHDAGSAPRVTADMHGMSSRGGMFRDVHGSASLASG